MGSDSGVPTFLFRAYYTDVGVFEILGYRCHVQPVLDEIHSLHERLLRCAEGGGRIPGVADLSLMCRDASRFWGATFPLDAQGSQCWDVRRRG